MTDQTPLDDIDTDIDGDTVSASATVAASPDEVFDFLRRPANHSIISGDETVKGASTGPDVVGEGDRFGMRMKMFGLPYKVTSQVVELTPGQRIAWSHLGGHRWRWDLAPAGDGQTKVTETFDLSTAKLPAALRLAGFPGRHRDNVTRSVANVRAHFAAR